MKNLYYILQGKEVVQVPTLEEAFKWREEIGLDGRRVAYDIIGEVKISTVFLTINHAWRDQLPLLFETMIFGGEHDQEEWRYRTYEEAERGHEMAVNLVKGSTNIDMP